MSVKFKIPTLNYEKNAEFRMGHPIQIKSPG